MTKIGVLIALPICITLIYVGTFIIGANGADRSPAVTVDPAKSPAVAVVEQPTERQLLEERVDVVAHSLQDEVLAFPDPGLASVAVDYDNSAVDVWFKGDPPRP